ncbi:MAG: anthranilate/aminodeoxychorismate synthase component II [Acidimicrobiia bacterium]|nr:anthranilate/aminodeoxychorismate synthase component II [Acidimicrobiia bacterium]
MKVLVVDNYDSFTYNLVQYLGELGATPIVHRNDVVDVAMTGDVDRVVISPGPGRPADAGLSADVVRASLGKRPVLGVCLGHQVIADVFGGEVGPAPEPRHGKVSTIRHDGTGVFEGLPDPFVATRYHSLCITRLPDELVATAWSEDDVIQGVRHRDLPVQGVQFHPESVMTEVGKAMLANFLAK